MTGLLSRTTVLPPQFSLDEISGFETGSTSRISWDTVPLAAPTSSFERHFASLKMCEDAFLIAAPFLVSPATMKRSSNKIAGFGGNYRSKNQSP